ncbi:MAG: glycosyltransferase family 29 protein [Sphingobium yanoikuyae]|uniref:glycosyltransferase family 29 protein n=1 Tax=Sphingobium yanoikuyae TaxID=13690 RepID=UPI001B2F2A76|nr:glycosyltransferase family 29 protein [Sphingobium yanoikuyae]
MRDISNLSPREWKAIAAQAEDEEDLALAATALDHLLKQNARDDILLARLFRVYSNGGQRQKALQLAESAFADGVRGRRLISMYILSDFTSYNLPNCLDDIEAKLSLFRHNPAVEGRAAMAYAWHGDVDRALDHARVAIARADEAATADMIRLMLARRVYQLSHRDAADRICRMGRQRPDLRPAILFDRLLVRTGNVANDATTHQLFRQLLAMDDFPRRTELVAQHIDFRWRLNGPSPALLDEIDQHLASGPRQDIIPLTLMKLSMAMQLGDEALALRTLRSHPELARKASACLPVARLLRDHGTGTDAPVDPEVAAYASLYDELADSEAVLRKRLGNPDVTCAVVGNSSCEIGRGHGAQIDAHDEVVRFNRFDTSPPFDRDYGSRTTVLVRVGNDRPEIGIDMAPNTLVLISSASILYRGRAWRAALRMRDEGHQLCVFPQRFQTQLSKMLVGSPSSGLSFVHLLKALRGTLQREDFFGFAFVDQIGSQAKSAHYFEAAKPSAMHQWDRELEIFNAMFDDGASCD